MLTATPSWELPFKGKTLDVLGALIETLPNVLPTRRWFGGKARRIENIRIVESIAIPPESTTRLLVVVVEYADSSTDIYTLPVTLAYGHEAENVRRRFPQAVIAS